MERRVGQRPQRLVGAPPDYVGYEEAQQRGAIDWLMRASRRLHGTDVWRAFIRDAHAAEIARLWSRLESRAGSLRTTRERSPIAEA